MNPFQFLTRAFIDVFGITHPTEQQERRAAWFICSLLALIVLGIAFVFFALYEISHPHLRAGGEAAGLLLLHL